jgi:hypothetical protein
VKPPIAVDVPLAARGEVVDRYGGGLELRLFRDGGDCVGEWVRHSWDLERYLANRWPPMRKGNHEDTTNTKDSIP